MSDPLIIDVDDKVGRVLFLTMDDQNCHADGKPLPAMTTLLYRICDNNPDKFEEACRIIELFIKKALEV